MKGINWTNEQRSVINSTGALLVSAAAGSGKTSVLINRVIEKLLLKTNPCSLDELLMVTFSNAAAEQMKTRIRRELKQKLQNNPKGSAKLQLQLELIDSANCCTFHSFCLKVIRENAAVLGLSPNFSIVTEAEGAKLKALAFEKALEEFYDSEDLQTLPDICEFECDDEKLEANLLKFYDFSRSKPFYKDFWQEIESYYSCEMANTREDKFVQTVLNQSEEILRFCAHAAKINQKLALKCGLKKQEQVFKDDFALVSELLGSVKSAAPLSFLRQHINGVSPLHMPTIKAGEIDEQDRQSMMQIRKIMKEKLEQLKTHLLCFSEDFVEADRKYSQGYFALMLRIARAFDKEFIALKRARNLVDFADIEHLTLELFYEQGKDGKQTKTPLAKEIAGQFNEILVDEFQDINEVQNLIISAISKGYKNVFMVGDVKQSIYRFRHAVPEIFLKKKDSLPDFDGENFPAKIFLNSNFRSSEEVINSINFIFSRIMKKATAGVDYDSTQELVPGVVKTFCEPGFVLAVMEQDVGSAEAIALEAKYIANYIAEKMQDPNFKIMEGDQERRARYSDFCVLLRSAKDRAEVYRSAMVSAGIPVDLQLSNSFWQRKEVMSLVSLLRAIDNPLESIPLAATMSSGLFSFSLDEITSIKLLDKSSSLYANLKASESEKCQDFLRELNELSEVFKTHSLCEALGHIFVQKNFLALSMAVNSDPKRVKLSFNLFLGLAERAQALGYGSLFKFIKYIEQEQAANLAPDDSPEVSFAEHDAVKVMSIHKSKGLEFPVCFIANTTKNFNRVDTKSRFLLHRELGAACMKCTPDGALQTSTIFREAIVATLQDEIIAEELRLLYVALTRAKSQIVMPVVLKDVSEYLAELVPINSLIAEGKICNFALQHHQNYAALIFLALISHPDFCKQFGLPQNRTVATKAKFKLERIDPLLLEKKNPEPGQAPPQAEGGNREADCEILKTLRQNLEFKYPYADAAKLPPRVSVSSLLEQPFAGGTMPMPKFLTRSGDEVSAAEIGSLMHKFMQFCSYGLAAQDFKKELDRLVNLGYFTAKEVALLPQESLKAFFESQFYLNIVQRAKVVHKEVKFSVNLKSARLFSQASGLPEETTNVHGIADCVLEFDDEIFLLDFKSDKIKNLESLAQKYKYQLYIYKVALAPSFSKPITRLFVYSWFKNQEVEVLGGEDLEKLTPEDC